MKLLRWGTSPFPCPPARPVLPLPRARSPGRRIRAEEPRAENSGGEFGRRSPGRAGPGAAKGQPSSPSRPPLPCSPHTPHYRVSRAALMDLCWKGVLRSINVGSKRLLIKLFLFRNTCVFKKAFWTLALAEFPTCCSLSLSCLTYTS